MGRADRLALPMSVEPDEAPAMYDANGVKPVGAGTVVVVLATVVYAVYSGSSVEVVVAPTYIVLVYVKIEVEVPGMVMILVTAVVFMVRVIVLVYWDCNIDGYYVVVCVMAGAVEVVVRHTVASVQLRPLARLRTII